MDDKFSALLTRLEAVTTKLEGMDTGSAPGAAAGGAASIEDDVVPPMVLAFDDFLNGAVATYVAAAGKIGMPEVRTSSTRAVATPPFIFLHTLTPLARVCL